MDPKTLNPMGIDLSPSSIFAGIIFGAVGLYIFRFARRESNYSLIFISIALMSYTLFTHGPLQDWGAGIALTGLAYYIRNNSNLTG